MQSPIPAEQHLLQLVTKTDESEISFILAGGLGIYLKHRWVTSQVEAGRWEPLIQRLPDVRATQDIDVFLEREAYFSPKRGRVRSILDELDYEPTSEFFIFKKKLETGEQEYVSVDLLAPHFDDERFRLGKPPRISSAESKKRGTPTSEKLHAYLTPEAFAIEESPRSIPIGAHFVRVAHPFPALCMKVKAALDYEEAPLTERKPRGERHAADVYQILSMVNEDEWSECDQLTKKYRTHPEFRAIQRAVTSLFGSRHAPGCVIVARTTTGADLERFVELMAELFDLAVETPPS